METNKILSADFLDILFEGRNKDYGAYDLRKTYNTRLRNALILTAAFFLAIWLYFYIKDKIETTDVTKEQTVKDVSLQKAPDEPPPPPPPPPPKLPPPPPIKTIAFTPPVVHKDEEVIKPPPEVKELQETKIDTKNQEGEKSDVVAPPVEDKGTQIVEAPPKKEEDEDKVFTKVEIDASFPGGEGAWTRYVTKAIQNNIDELTEAGESGTCRVRFIVDKAGVVSDVEALTMKGTKLAEIAVNAIRKGPHWVPAQQNGRYVKAYREQPITFTIQEQ